MTDEPALLAAVAAAPDDDTPRLVYADWLDDHDRPARAEFVRGQCRLAAATPADDGHAELVERNGELGAWLRAFDPAPPAKRDGPLRVGETGYADYRRGFPDDVYGRPASESRSEFRRLVNALGRHLPASPAQNLRVYGLSPEQAAELVRHPVAAGLRGLTLSVGDDDFALDIGLDDHLPRMGTRSRAADVVAEGFARSPHVRHLRALRLFCTLTEESAEVLARADLSGLAELVVWPAVASPRAVAVLAQAAWFPNLRVLGVGEHLGDAHLEALAALPPLPHLHTLRLENNRFEWFGLRALAASKAFPALAALDLNRNPVGDEGAADLARAAWSLRELRLRATGLGNRGVRALLKGKLLDGARELELGGNLLTAPAVKALAASPKLADLRGLDVTYSRVGPEGFAALGRSKNFRRLVHLDLGAFSDERGKVKASDVAGFLAALDAPQLRRLDLSGYPVDAAGAKALATRPEFGSLRRLRLQECGIGNAGLAAPAASPHLRELVVLDLWANRLTDAAPLLDPATFPRLAECRLNGNPIPAALAAALAARRGVE